MYPVSGELGLPRKASHRQRRKRYVPKPRVAARRLPWVGDVANPYPEGVASARRGGQSERASAIGFRAWDHGFGRQSVIRPPCRAVGVFARAFQGLKAPGKVPRPDGPAGRANGGSQHALSGREWPGDGAPARGDGPCSSVLLLLILLLVIVLVFSDARRTPGMKPTRPKGERPYPPHAGQSVADLLTARAGSRTRTGFPTGT